MADADRGGILALVHRGWDHLKLQRPLAAWASWQQALRIDPDDRAAREALAVLAGAEDLPLAARQVYRFRPPQGEGRRARWDEALRGRDLADLDDAAATFRALSESDPDDGAAALNLGLCLAWMGENRAAIDALGRAVSASALEATESAVEAGTLVEVLRQGAGAEDLADDVSVSLVVPWGADDGDPVAWLSSFATLRPVEAPAGPGAGEVRVFEWLDRAMPEPRDDLTADDLPRVRASVLVAPGSIRFASPEPRSFWHVDRDVAALLHDRGKSFDRRTTPLPLALMDAAVGLFRMPSGLDNEQRRRPTREAVEHYFEHEWIGRMRRCLVQIPGVLGAMIDPHGLRGILANPALDDRSRAVAQAMLSAMVRVREQLASRPRGAALYAGYPFDRLRRRLGIAPVDPSTIDPGDLSYASTSELEAIAPSGLDDAKLLDAYRSCRDVAPVLAQRFADEIVRRHPDAIVHVDPPDLAAHWYRAARGRDEWENRYRRAVALDDEIGTGLVRRKFAFLHISNLWPERLADVAAALDDVVSRFPDDAALALKAARMFTMWDDDASTEELVAAIPFLRRAIEAARRSGDVLTEKYAEAEWKALERRGISCPDPPSSTR